MRSPKIFGIGLNKTGTTTLGQCGELLGLKCIGFDRRLLREIVNEKKTDGLKDIVDQYDLFEDWPWPLVYRELDKMYPGSKFILTTRLNGVTWLNSLKEHSMKTSPFNHSRKDIYGFNYAHGKEDHFIDFYDRHNNEVREYFKERPNDFREFCWERGDGIEDLCYFLGKSVIQDKTPHANRSGDSRSGIVNGFLNNLLRRL